MCFFLLRKELSSVATLMCTSEDKFVGKCYMPWKINTDNIACVQCRSEKACFWWHVFLQPCRRWDFCCHRTWIVQVRGWGWGGVGCGEVGWGGVGWANNVHVRLRNHVMLRWCNVLARLHIYAVLRWCNVLARLHIYAVLHWCKLM